jgi:NADH-ubiquinone oxidoreductase chain 5
LIYFIFWAPISSYRKYAEQAHESSSEISISLLVLSFGSIFIGYLFRDFMIGLGSLFLSNNIKIQGESFYGPDSEFIHVLIKNLPLLASALGLISFFVILQMFYKSV